MAKIFEYDARTQAFETMNILHGLRLNKESCDFVIKVGNEEIFAHRFLLMANSKYYHAMLTHDTLENQNGCVEYKDMDPECVKACIDSIYCQKIFVSDENRPNLLQVADRLQILKLFNHLLKYYQTYLSVVTFFEVKLIADMSNCNDLLESCNMYAFCNFQHIVRQTGFLEVSKEYLSGLLESGKNSTPPTNKLQALIYWTRHDSGNRQPFLKEMLRRLDLSKVSIRYRWYLMHTEPLTKENLDCVKMLGASFITSVDTAELQPQEDKEESTGFAVFDDASRQLQYYEIGSENWKQMHPLQEDMQKRKLFAVAFEKCIYVFIQDRSVRGVCSVYINNTLYSLQYGDEDASWQKRGVVPNFKLQHAVAGPKGIYISGELDYKHGLFKTSVTTVYSLGPPLYSLTELISFSESKFPSVFVFLNQCLYFIGVRRTQEVKVYDLIAREWTVVSPMLSKKCNCFAAAHGNKIFVIGDTGEYGVPSASSMEIYCDETNIWTSAKPPVNSRNISDVFVAANKMFILSMAKNDGSKAVLQKYDEEGDEWKTLEMPEEMNMNPICGVGICMK